MMDIQSLMAQAQRVLGEMESKKKMFEEELSQITVTGTAGGGAVQISLSGNREVRLVKIDPDAVDKDKIELLEDLVYAALSDALKQASVASDSKMSELSEGLEIGGIDVSSIKDMLE
ncbi:YbaB/EbfC family nucleoid-associated protein [bacterium]|nr:YbaB/EbfC family nucleoid-associated protein [bacterium]